MVYSRSTTACPISAVPALPHISHPDRVVYPRPRITKQRIAEYYQADAAWMLQDVHSRVDRTLDQRLAMSARMVSGLMQRATLMPAKPDLLLEPITVGGGQGIAVIVEAL